MAAAVPMAALPGIRRHPAPRSPPRPPGRCPRPSSRRRAPSAARAPRGPGRPRRAALPSSCPRRDADRKGRTSARRPHITRQASRERRAPWRGANGERRFARKGAGPRGAGSGGGGFRAASPSWRTRARWYRAGAVRAAEMAPRCLSPPCAAWGRSPALTAGHLQEGPAPSCPHTLGECANKWPEKNPVCVCVI